MASRVFAAITAILCMCFAVAGSANAVPMTYSGQPALFGNVTSVPGGWILNPGSTVTFTPQQQVKLKDVVSAALGLDANQGCCAYNLEVVYGSGEVSLLVLGFSPFATTADTLNALNLTDLFHYGTFFNSLSGSWGDYSSTLALYQDDTIAQFVIGVDIVPKAQFILNGAPIVEYTRVPEPSTGLVFLVGLSTLLLIKRRKKYI